MRKWALVLICFLFAGGSAPPAQSTLTRLEYYLRWSRGEFPKLKSRLPASLAQTGLAAAWRQAELPPQYQNAFSLVLEPDAQAQAVNLEYNYQKIIDPKTRKHVRKRLGTEEYRQLQQLTSGKLACEARVSPGWAGPAPRVLELTFGSRSQSLYVDGMKGPAGPTRELSNQNKRAYLCQDALAAFLDKLLAETAR